MVTNKWLNFPYYPKHPADLFFVYPTLYVENRKFANINDQKTRAICLKYIYLYEKMLDKVDLYVPFYRQTSIQVLKNLFEGKGTYEDLQMALKEVSFEDIKNRFEWYLDNRNSGRPFFLAGHSQGSILLMMLLMWIKKNRPQIMRQIIAVYLVGWSVNQEFLNFIGLKFAESRTDTGVIISWNTMTPDCKFNPFLLPGNLSINPINWKRDSEYASKLESLGSNISTRYARITDFGFADAQIDKNSGGVVSNVNKDVMVDLGVLNLPKEILHSFDYDLFYYDVRQNIEDRTNSFYKNNPSFIQSNQYQIDPSIKYLIENDI